MTSPKQVEANRNNALLSTGHKTEEGKMIVSQNAITHGIFSKNVLAYDESEDEFKCLQIEFYNLFKPEGILETILLDRVIAATWRLSRIGKTEPILIKLASQNWDGKDLSEIFDNYLGRRLALMSRYDI